MLSKKIAQSFPTLKLSLLQAGMDIEPYKFVQKNLVMAFYLAFTMAAVSGLVLFKAKPELLLVALLIFPIMFFIGFLFFMNSPTIKSKKRVKEIDKEVVFAGRFLLIELSAGVPLFDALSNVAKSYKGIGKYFQEIVDRVEIGKPIDVAINEVMEITPSDNFRKIVWQIMNSLRTGADVSVALESIVEQISREQIIEVKNYGKKLNPMVMMYLMMAVIVPSLGVTMLSLMSSFVGIQLSTQHLIIIAFGVFVVQAGFLMAIKGSRPGLEI
ncbi:MAG TPA: type II secretion system F family protein [Candidatus Nanoarchaeia archaeon]|nr:type II secretion system F family protein [Candidatus Nanoarchaeia archaeon]